MSKIGDLFVRLGLKKEGFDKGIRDAKQETGGLGKAFEGLKVKALAAWGAIGAAVVKFAKDAISMTQTWGDSWNVTMAGIKGAYSSFVRNISSGDGWNNLFANMREAYRQARETAKALDELFERNTSYNYQEAALEKRNSELNLIMRDQSKSDAERKAAAQELINNEKELAEVRRGIAVDQAKAIRDNFKAQTGMNDEEIDFLVKNYNQNRDLIKQAQDYLDKKKQIAAAGTGSASAGMYGNYSIQADDVQKTQQALKQLNDSTDDSVKALARTLEKYNKGNDDLVKGLQQADIAVLQVDTDANRAMIRANNTLGMLNKETSVEASAVAEQAETIRQAFEAIPTVGNNITGLASTTSEAADRMADSMKKIVEATQKADLAMRNGFGSFEEYADFLARMKDVTAEASRAIRSAIVDGMSGSFDVLADAITGVKKLDAKSLFGALLQPVAEACKSIGELVMLEGLAMVGFKDSIKNPWTAIAAGAALMAAGALASSGISKAVNSVGGGAGTSSSGSAENPYSSAYSGELTIYVQGDIKGDTIAIAGSKTLNSWNR